MAQSFPAADAAFLASPRETLTAVWLTGMPRGGTTLLSDLLNESQHVALMAEYPLERMIAEMTPILNYQRIAEDNPGGTEHGHTRMGDDADWSTLENLTYCPHENNVRHGLRYPTVALFRDIVANVARTALQKPSSSIIGSKHFLDDLHGLALPRTSMVFGPPKVLFMVRNPEDQINSSLNRRNRDRAGLDSWPIGDVAEAIADVRRVARQLFSLVAIHGARCFIVKYEDLVSREQDTLAAIGAFLGIDVSDLGGYATRERPHSFVLTGSETAAVRSAFGPTIERWGELDLTGPADRSAPLLAALLEPFPLDQAVRYDAMLPPRHTGAGWSAPEPDGLWSDGNRAQIDLPSAAARDLTLSLAFLPFLPTPDSTMTFVLRLNGVVARCVCSMSGPPVVTLAGSDQAGCSWRIDGWDHLRLTRMPMRPGLNTLTLEFLEPRSPAEFTDSPDHRKLALKLRYIQLDDPG